MRLHPTSSLLFFHALTLFHPTVAQEVTVNSVREGYAQSKLVPDVLPSFEPAGLLEVVYTVPNSNDRIRVRPGMNLTVSQTASPPSLGLSGFASSSIAQSFVAVLLDPDAPTPQNRSLAQFLHFIGGDLSLNGTLFQSTSQLVNRSQASVEYVGPGPPAGSDPHRYAFLVFTTSRAGATAPFNVISAPFANSTTPRTGFDLVKFARDTGLVGPIAGTFFYVGPEDSGSSPASVGPSVGRPSASSTGPEGAAKPNSAVGKPATAFVLALAVFILACF